MSTAQLQRRKSEWKKFNNGTKLERIWMHHMDPDRYELHDSEMEYMERMRAAFHILCEERQQAKAINRIYEELKDVYSTRRSIYNLVNDTKTFYGNIIKRNKEFDRMVIKDRLMELSERAKDTGNLKQENKAYELVMKLLALDKHDGEGIDWEQLELPDISFTHDPAVLEAEDAEIVEDEEE